MDIYKTKRIIKFSDNENREVDDIIAIEKRLVISVNGEEVLSLYCSPSMIRELVTGVVATEGLIEGEWCAERMSIDYGDEIRADVPAAGTVVIKEGTRTSGCIGGITFSRDMTGNEVFYTGQVRKQDLIMLNNEFQKISEPYRLTGCIHSAALIDKDRVLIHAEDIGRHNAVDKLTGYCLLEKITMDDKTMLVSGRLSSEMVLKCARWKVPIVASRTAPTMRAVDIAERVGITLIGFLREKRFNVYSHPERISE